MGVSGLIQRYAGDHDPTVSQLRTFNMSEILTCTWALTAMAVPKLTRTSQWASKLLPPNVQGQELQEQLLRPVRLAERLGIDRLLVAQRWWGTGEEIEGSTYDCMAMTAFYAAHTQRIRLITAIHPGFFLPAPIAKWGATLIDRPDGPRAVGRSTLPPDGTKPNLGCTALNFSSTTNATHAPRNSLR